MRQAAACIMAQWGKSGGNQRQASSINSRAFIMGIVGNIRDYHDGKIDMDGLKQKIESTYSSVKLADVDLTAPNINDNLVKVTQETLKDFVKNNKNSFEINAKELSDTISRLADATQRKDDLGWLSTLMHTVSFYTTDKTARAKAWFAKNFGTNIERATDSEFAVAIDNLDRVAEGEMSHISTNIIRPMLDKFRPFAKKLGMDEYTFASMIGHYGLASHMEEANAHLQNNLEKELADMNEVVTMIMNEIANGNQDPELDFQLKIMNRAVEMKTSEYTDFLDGLNKAQPKRWTISAGMTNAQAKIEMENIKAKVKGKLSEQELELLAQTMSDAHAKILYRQYELGLVTKEEIENVPDFKRYFKIATVTDKTESANFVYDPSRIHKRTGNNFDTLINPFQTILKETFKTGQFVGYQDLGRVMMAMHAHNKERNYGDKEYKNDIEAYDYHKTVKQGLENLSAEALKKLENSILYVMPMPDGKSKRMLLRFNPTINDTNIGINGEYLNSILTNTMKEGSYLKSLANATGIYGSLNTHYSPAFGIKAFLYGGMENIAHIFSRELQDTNGNRYKGSAMFGQYAFNAIRSIPDMLKGLKGDGDVYFDEFVKNGLMQNFSYFGTRGEHNLGVISKKELGQLGKYDVSTYERIKNTLGNYGGAVGRFITAYNNVLNGAQPYALYKTLRQKGMTEDGASHVVRSFNNMSQKGFYTNTARQLMPFVVPAMQGGANVARDLGLTLDGNGDVKLNKKGLATLIVGSAITSGLYNLARALMGQDEEGKYLMDSIGFSTLYSSMCIPIGDGKYLKLGYGYGYGRISAAMSIGFQRVLEGTMKPADYAFHVMAAVLKNASPINVPDFDFTEKPTSFIMQVISPEIIAPLVEVATNTDHFGRPVRNEYGSEYETKANSGRMTTPKGYHVISQGLSSMGLDLAPEEVKHLIDGYFTGGANILTGWLNNTDRYVQDNYTSVKEDLGPILTAMGVNTWYSKNYNQDLIIYNKTLKDFKDRVAKENIDFTASGLSGDKLDLWRANQLEEAGWDSTDIENFMEYLKTERELKKHRAKFRKDIKELMRDGDIDDTEIQGLFDTLGLTENEAIRDLRSRTGI